MSIYTLLSQTISRSDTDALTQPSSSAGSAQSTASVDTHTKALLVEMHTIISTLPSVIKDGNKEEMRAQRDSDLLCIRNLGTFMM